MGKIKLNVQTNEKEVSAFLASLKRTLCSEEFDIDKDFMMVRKKKEPGKEQYSTIYTLADLDYDVSDVIERLKELTIKEYSETLMDIDDVNPPLLFVFGKDINGKQVYIKLKLKGEQARHVLCVSFHYAERNMTFPFA